MTFSGVAHVQLRPQGRKRAKGNKNRTRSNFQPTEAQVICAAGRVVGVLKRMHGYYPCHASEDRVHKLLVEWVRNRGHQLGRTPDEVAITIRSALRRLEDENKIRLEKNSDGSVSLILAAWKPGKVHKDKYHYRRMVPRLAIRAA